MEKIEITTNLVARYNTDDHQIEYYLTKDRWWVGDNEIVLAKNMLVEVEVPDFDLVTFQQKAIATLREKQQKAMADCQVRINELEQQIKELLLITHQTDVLKEGEYIPADSNYL